MLTGEGIDIDKIKYLKGVGNHTYEKEFKYVVLLLNQLCDQTYFSISIFNNKYILDVEHINYITSIFYRVFRYQTHQYKL